MPTFSPYDSTNPIKVSRPATNSFILSLAKKIGRQIPFTKPTNLICTSFVKNNLPSSLDDITDFNNEKLTCNKFNKLTNAIYIFAIISKSYWQIGFPFVFGAGILTDLIASEPYYFLTLTPNILNSILLGLLALSFLLYIPWVIIANTTCELPGIGTKAFFEFNRKTGMVTKFEKNKTLYSYPFIEFDCYLMTRFTNKGFPRHSLELFPRYQNTRKSINISNLLSQDFSDINEYLRLWNMFQSYMDISHPLPDISILEKYREKDSVTVAYDKETGRNSRYWRDMSDEQYTQRLKQLDEEQKNVIPLGDPLPFEIIDDASAA